MDQDPPGTPLPGEERRSDTEKTTEKITQKQPNFYSDQTRGPFKVFVTPKNDSVNKFISPIFVGKTLINKKVAGVKEISKLGRKKVTIEFNNGKYANEFIKLNITEFESYDMYIPQHLMSCTGSVMIDKNETIEEITNNMECGGRKIMNVRRLNKRMMTDTGPTYEPSAWVAITFEGTALPKYVSLYKNILTVSTYMRQTIICGRCLYYGHSTGNCKSSKPKCGKCSSENHEMDNCNSTGVYCFHCKSEDHSPMQKNNCCEFEKQKKIKEMMASYNISFEEARSAFIGKKPINITTEITGNPQPNIASFNLSQHFPDTLRSDQNYNKEVASLPATNERFLYSQAIQKEKPEGKKRKILSPCPLPPRDLFFETNTGRRNPIFTSPFYGPREGLPNTRNPVTSNNSKFNNFDSNRGQSSSDDPKQPSFNNYNNRTDIHSFVNSLSNQEIYTLFQLLSERYNNFSTNNNNQ